MSSQLAIRCQLGSAAFLSLRRGTLLLPGLWCLSDYAVMLIQLPTPAESSPSQNEASRQQKLNQHIEEQTARASCVQGQEGQGWG